MRWLQAALTTPTDECIIWPFDAPLGYGRLTVDGKMTKATHVSLILSGLPRPDYPGFHGASALHSCPGGDNPSCVNPRHLRWGTIKENHADMQSRGRRMNNAGELNACAKLTADQVAEIRSRDYSKRGAKSAMAREFGITTGHASYLVSGRGWTDVS